MAIGLIGNYEGSTQSIIAAAMGEEDSIAAVPASNVRCKLVRSMPLWAASGCGVPIDDSMHTAWLEAIAQAKTCIYIEQQFLITALVPILHCSCVLSGYAGCQPYFSP